MNARLEGGCQVPIGGHAVLDGATLHLRGLVATLDGTTLIRREARGDAGEGRRLGEAVAESLLAGGAGIILREVYADAG